MLYWHEEGAGRGSRGRHMCCIGMKKVQGGALEVGTCVVGTVRTHPLIFLNLNTLFNPASVTGRNFGHDLTRTVLSP